MTKEEVQLISFNVIAYSGEAFNSFVDSVAMASKFDFEKAEELLRFGEKSLTKAHQAQTELLQAEIRGEEIPFSIILIHGQDHLMHATTYEQVAKDNIGLYRVLKGLE